MHWKILKLAMNMWELAICLSIQNMRKDCQYICLIFIFTAVCHVTPRSICFGIGLALSHVSISKRCVEIKWWKTWSPSNLHNSTHITYANPLSAQVQNHDLFASLVGSRSHFFLIISADKIEKEKINVNSSRYQDQRCTAADRLFVPILIYLSLIPSQ